MEKKIEQYLVRKVKAAGGAAFKFVSPGNAGVPDRLIIMPQGRMYFVELKDEGQQPTKQQKFMHGYLHRMGFKVFVLDSKARVDTFIELIAQERQ